MTFNHELTNGKTVHKTKRMRKIAQRLMLQSKVKQLLRSCYHNATLGSWTVPDEEIFPADNQWEEVNFYMEMILNDINKGVGDKDYIEGRIASDWGKVYTYGRGGRTCVPEEWEKIGGNHFFNNPQLDDLPRRKLWALLVDIPAWNKFVAEACSSENLQCIIDERYAMLKEEHDEKMREYARLLTL